MGSMSSSGRFLDRGVSWLRIRFQCGSPSSSVFFDIMVFFLLYLVGFVWYAFDAESTVECLIIGSSAGSAEHVFRR